jgi:hypothetical protein
MEECGMDLDDEDWPPVEEDPIEFFPTNRLLGFEAVALPLPPRFDSAPLLSIDREIDSVAFCESED